MFALKFLAYILTQLGKSREKQYTRRFKPDVYERCEWTVGVKLRMRCFVFPVSFLVAKMAIKCGQKQHKRIERDYRNELTSMKYAQAKKMDG